ncbi:hypothetical protein INS49_010322 [Diaporthe citri]|uniref:uncharacterized protein n=1 Tax=Diaporthe citri TaxID=83186 RepID=UPI001C8073E3|nr:uncharacterized protein INS49_010322 [Diaporthe citri]KAG6362093.1 hypothetical protein INS49_010322 [Diaporthe citri]
MAADSPSISPTVHSEDGHRGDDRPLMPHGTEWNGKDLLGLVRDDSSPFANIWDVRILLEEVETQVQAQVVDIPEVHAGANNYGFHLGLSDDRDVMARVARADVLRSLLTQAARSRSALLNKPLPAAFVATWLFWANFQPVEWMPKMFPLHPAGNRDFCIAMLEAKFEGLIGNQGDRIGWEEDKLTVGPLASAAKQSLLRLIPLILPEGDDEVLYRLVLQHDDFGLHSISVDVDEAGELSLTSVYDWETGCIIPVILSEIEFSIAGCRLIVDEKGEPSVHLRSDQEREPERSAQNQRYSADFLNAIYECSPYLKRVLRAGNDARRLWSTLKRWKGDSPEEFFGQLGSWAEARMGEMGAEIPAAHQPDLTEQAGPKVEKNAFQNSRFECTSSLQDMTLGFRALATYVLVLTFHLLNIITAENFSP